MVFSSPRSTVFFSVLKGVKVVRVGVHDRNWNILNQSVFQVLAVNSNYPCLTPVNKVLGHELKLAPKPALMWASKSQACVIHQCLNCLRRVPFLKICSTIVGSLKQEMSRTRLEKLKSRPLNSDLYHGFRCVLKVSAFSQAHFSFTLAAKQAQPWGGAITFPFQSIFFFLRKCTQFGALSN